MVAPVAAVVVAGARDNSRTKEGSVHGWMTILVCIGLLTSCHLAFELSVFHAHSAESDQTHPKKSGLAIILITTTLSSATGPMTIRFESKDIFG